MSYLIYIHVAPADTPIVWLHGQVKSPALTPAARIEAGLLLRRLQRGERLELPHSRCHEPRIPDETVTWRIVYRVDSVAVVVADVFAMKTQKTHGPSWRPASGAFGTTT